MRSNQLDLFESKNVIRLTVSQQPKRRFPMPASICVFPPVRQRSLVVEGADKLTSLPNDARRQKWWQSWIRSHRRRLLALDVSEQQAEALLLALRNEVQRELDDRAGRRKSPGGGAA